MLDDSAKQLIVAEERFRQEVRDQLDSARAKPLSVRVVAFFNSPLGLWVLTTLLVGGLSFAYARWDEVRATRNAFRQEVAMLDAEIAARVNDLYKELRQNIKNQELNVLIASTVENNEGVSRRGVFPQYGGRSLRSLLLELEQLAPPSERRELQETVRKLYELEKLEITGQYYVSDPVSPQILHRARSIITDDIGRGRWSIQ